MSKAKKLLGIAYATFKRGELEIAKNIFALAAEEPDAPEVMGPVEAPKPNPEQLKAKLAKALQEGNLDEAQSALDDLKGLGVPLADEVKSEEAPVEPPPGAPVEEPVVSEEEPVVAPPVEEPVEGEEEELPPVQVAALVRVAKKIAAAGHKDLAEKITAALAQ